MINTKEVSKDAKNGSAHHLRQSCVDSAHTPPGDTLVKLILGMLVVRLELNRCSFKPMYLSTILLLQDTEMIKLHFDAPSYTFLAHEHPTVEDASECSFIISISCKWFKSNAW